MITIKKATRETVKPQIAITIIAHPRKIRNRLKNFFLEFLLLVSFLALPGTLEYIEQGGSFLAGFLTFWAALGYIMAFSVANTVWKNKEEEK